MKLHIGVLISVAVVVIGWLVFSYVDNSTTSSEKISKSARVSVSTSPEMESAQAKAGNISLVEDMTALRQEVALLRREIANMQLQLREQAMAATDKVPAREESDDVQMKSVEEEERANHERTETLEAAFIQESVDQQWADEATHAIKEALGREDMGQLVLQSLECRSSSCRMQLANNGSGDMPKSLPLLMQLLSETVPYVTAGEVEDSAGGTSLVLYMSQDANDAVQQNK